MIGALAPRVHGKGVPAAKLACNSMRPQSMSLDRLAVDVCAVDVEVPFETGVLCGAKSLSTETSERCLERRRSTALVPTAFGGTGTMLALARAFGGRHSVLVLARAFGDTRSGVTPLSPSLSSED